MKPPKTIGALSQTGQSYGSAPESSGFEWDVHYIANETFVDDGYLRKGDHLNGMHRVIETPRLFVVVLAKRYADSRWCLMELTKIMQTGRLILPVFYDVQPFEVSHQTGPFEAAFRRHELDNKTEKTAVDEWSDALWEVAGMSGMIYHAARAETSKSCILAF
ncbi:TMV resistance protein [Nymphaea thermarum]|nr:TMV resistance protein [Nymphaea thermarum]